MVPGCGLRARPYSRDDPQTNMSNAHFRGVGVAETTAYGAVQTGVAPRTRRARIGASAAFAVQGLCFAAVIARVPVLQTRFGLSDGQLTIILGAVPIVAGVGSVLAGVLAPRLGSGAVLRVAGLGVAASTAAQGLADRLVGLYVAV